MTVLITGAGLIGTHTARTLLDQGVGVVLFDPEPNLPYIESVVGPDRKLFRVERGDVRDLPRIVDLMLRVGVTRILHTAALRGAQVEENPSLAFHLNVAGTLNLLEATRIRGLARVVLVSSSAIYPATDGGASPLAEREPYGVPGKLTAAYQVMSEIMARAFQQAEGVNAIVCRPCETYGRGRYDGSIPDDPQLERLIRHALETGGAPLSVDVPAEERAYVKEVALGIREAIFVEKPSTRVYNLGSGEIVTAGGLATVLNRVIPGLRATAASQAAESPPLLDCSLARQELDYRPTWGLDQAINDYVNEIRLLPR
jgi:nucleoside-diphosphate-sugar epimerase